MDAKSLSLQKRRLAAPARWVAAVVTLACGLAYGASTDIANQPLANAAAVAAKPNIMFILDNSGSMADAYMPDDMSNTGKYGYTSSQCNGVAFDPTQPYDPPLKADGSSYPDINWLAAPSDGFTNTGSSSNTSSTSLTVGTGSFVIAVPGAGFATYAVGNAVTVVSTTDPLVWMSGDVTAYNGSTKSLTVNVTGKSGSGTFSSWAVGIVTNLTGKTYYTYTGTQAAMGWTYTASGVITTTTFYQECTSNIGSTPGSSKFTLNTVTAASTTALKQKYANWFSYYSTRRLMMRTAAGKAFNSLDNNFRVGFSTISDTTATQGTNRFVDIGDFDATKKADFYTSLYGATGSSSTPLRGALSKAGRYFANKAPGQTSDPMQYSCQRNYAILSTDGYWNTGSESGTYTALNVTGASIGQQDDTEVKPMWDGTSTAVTEKTTTTTVQHKQTTTNGQVTTKVWTRYVWNVSLANNCGNNRPYTVTVQPQTRTETIVSNNTTLTDVTTQLVHTKITVNGTVTTDSDAAPVVTTATVGNTTTVQSDTISNWANNGGLTTFCASSNGLQEPSPDLVPGSTNYSSTTDNTCVNNNCNFNATTNGANTSTNTTTPNAPSTITLSTDGPTAVTTTTTSTTGGSTNSLADIAEYYYMTDLRTSALSNCTGALGTNICNNTLTALDRDLATHQHMTTYTIGLGVSGTLTYDANYLGQTSGSYVQLTNGSVTWPTPTASSNGGDATNIDDLWHAAVNGRGRYFATTNATSLANALAGALADARKVVGSAAGASTNSLKPVAGEDNRAYVATYTTVEWTGDVSAYPLDATTGVITTTAAARVWSASAQLDTKLPGNRVIKYKAPSSTTLKDFTFANLSSDYASYFSSFCTQAIVPAQCASFDATQAGLANSSSNLIDYLRGADTYEAATNATNPLYRERLHKLGDIVNGSPVYVKTPPFAYADAGYSSFVTAQASRTAMVYAPANDGMLHAFNAATGDEVWAYVPTFVLPNLYRLADTAFATNHRYFVDGTPVVGDIQVGGVWKTILVGGLNSGGRGYYALDITTPSTPTLLWEFTDTNMGLTYGNPIITKRPDGTWVVAVTSGYNNTAGDGQGHLYVLNANTGTVVWDVPTLTGSSGSPSGLGKINAWVDSETDNTARRFYGGDLAGNVWRFDTEDLIAPSGREAVKLASLMVGATPQPITVAPQLAEVRYAGSDYPAVFVATGRYLGSTDVSDTTQQSIYGIKDTLGSSGWGDFRTRTDVVTQTVTVGANKSTVTSNAVDWATKAGWKLDLPASKERVATEMVLQFTNLVAASAIPGGTECDPAGGSSWLYQIDIATGGASDSSGTLSTILGNFLTVGLTWFQTAGGENKAVRVGSDSTVGTQDLTAGKGSSGVPHRTSWRELVNN